jgi:HSP20 family protein
MVEMTNDGLVIQGERKRESEEMGKGWCRSERSYGQFYRLIPLPEGVSAEQAKASFDNGVLEVSASIPESQRRHRSIPIEIGGGQTPRTQIASSGSGK